MTSAQSFRFRDTWCEIGIVLGLSFVFLGARFSVTGGKAVLCADSLQYADNAIALLDPHIAADFAFRKPGYSFLLAGVCGLFGSLGWPAILVNYLLIGLWPAGAYGLARQISEHRFAARLAAAGTLCLLTAYPWADRLMSECLYGTLLIAALMLIARGLRKYRDTTSCCPKPSAAHPDPEQSFPNPDANVILFFLVGGFMLALAWLTRSAAISVIAGVILIVFWQMRASLRRAALTIATLIGSILAAVLVECGMNASTHGIFRPCTGTFGPMLLMRMCALQGLPLAQQNFAATCAKPGSVPPDTKQSFADLFGQASVEAVCAALLPERGIEEAYVAHPLDVWVARHRAIRHMDEWQADDLFARAARRIMIAHPDEYLATSAYLLVHWGLRRPLRTEDPGAPGWRSMIRHPRADEDQPWYAYWALPGRDMEHSLKVTDRLTRQASRRASFVAGEPWSTLRFVYMRTGVDRIAAPIGTILRGWPLLAVPVCLIHGRRRGGTMLMLSVAMVADALLACLTAPSADAFQRFMDVWLPVDCALGGVAWVAVASFLRQRASAIMRIPEPRLHPSNIG